MAKKKKQQPVTVAFYALGCPKNMVDSERMLAEIAQAGFLITAEPDPSSCLQQEEAGADVVVVNTCSFIAPAIDEALEVIKHAVNCKADGSVKKVIVAGCLPQRLGTDLFNQANGIDAILGLGQRDAIARIIKKTLISNEKKAYLAQSPCTISNDRARLLISPGHWAYLRISQGCSHKCSFCTIPAIRGRFRSKPRKFILAEADELAQAGVVELNVIAQDTANWGRDLKIKNGLTALVKELEKIAGVKWLRLMYLYPAGIDDELIEAIVKSEKIVRYIDMPIQHINDKILKDMRRPDTKEHICRLIENLRSAIDDVILRTTLIVGFPGETDRQFDEMVEFINWAKFDALGCFRFYPESGTPAADMPNQVPDRIKKERLEELMLTQQKIAFDKNRNRIGTELICLVDSRDSQGTAQTRFYGQAPDIDSVCIIKNCSARPGDFINAKVVGTDGYDLVLKQI